MTPDERLRREERALLAGQGDAAGWAHLSREYERLGRRDDAVRAALFAQRAGRDDLEGLHDLAAGDGPWPSERADPQNRQRSPLDGPDEGVLRWRLELPRVCSGRPLVDVAGRVVLRPAHAGLFRVDADGRELQDLGFWRAHLEPVLVGGEPVAFDLAAGRFVGPDPAADVLTWRGEVSVARAFGGCFTRGDTLVAMGRDGDLRWTSPPRGFVHDVAVAADGRRLAVALWTGSYVRLRGLDAATGASVWEGTPRLVSPSERVEARVTAADDGTWLVAIGATLSRLDAQGEERWQRKLGGPVGAAASVGERVLVTTGTAVLELDLATGEPRWRRELRAGEPPTLDARGVAYVATYDGRVVGLRPGGATHCQAVVRGTGAPSALSIGWDGTAFVTVGRELVALR